MDRYYGGAVHAPYGGRHVFHTLTNPFPWQIRGTKSAREQMAYVRSFIGTKAPKLTLPRAIKRKIKRGKMTKQQLEQPFIIPELL